MSRLTTALRQLQEKIADRQRGRRAQRIAKAKADGAGPRTSARLSTFAPAADVASLFENIAAAVNADILRYTPPAMAAGQPVEAPEDEALLAPQAAPAPPAPEPAAPAQLEEPPAGPPPVVLTPPAEILAARALAHGEALAPQAAATPPARAAGGLATTAHLHSLYEAWQPIEHLLMQEGADHLPPTYRPCYAFLKGELDALSNDPSPTHPTPAPLLAKIKQAVTAFADRRTNDTLTLLKNALGGDPHNPTLLAMLSQVLYLLASTGQQTVLPEARDVAQRSTILSDKLKPSKLLFYRYMAISSEMAFSSERALAWLRETGYLDPMLLTGPQGLFAEQGLYLRGWAMLARIPVALWDEDEFSAMKVLMAQVVGGGAMYMLWYRMPLVQALATSKVPPPEIGEMEKLLGTALAHHAEAADGLAQMPLATSPLPWFLRVRFLNTVASVAPVPTFDQVLCMVALDGHSCREGVHPDKDLREHLHDSSLSYWRLWCSVVTPFKDVQQPYLLPSEETVNDAEFLSGFDALLGALKEAELQRIKPDMWEDLKPWMTRWQLEHLLASATGSSKPRSRFMPSLVPYTHFYHAWQEPVVSAVLASELIYENARRGAFASLFEIQAAFEGAARLVDDPVYGLLPAQKRALAAAKKHNPEKFGGMTLDLGGKGSSVLLLIMPVALIGGVAAIVQMSANWSQAIGLILALAGVAGVVLVNLGRR
ncbi:MAG: hypothetical protein GC129_00160 [Proteobacteria bacterium]|nr:hypothetical protein [Pseudomonadota bacterium]